MASTATAAFSPPGVGCSPRMTPMLTSSKPFFIPSRKVTKTRTATISCDVALKSNNSATISQESHEDEEEILKVGKKVRVKVPLKVYHVPRVPEVDLNGKEGSIKQYVGVWKGKKISANLPYKVEFLVEVEGRGPVKLFAHLKEDEFEYLD